MLLLIQKRNAIQSRTSGGDMYVMLSGGDDYLFADDCHGYGDAVLMSDNDNPMLCDVDHMLCGADHMSGGGIQMLYNADHVSVDGCWMLCGDLQKKDGIAPF